MRKVVEFLRYSTNFVYVEVYFDSYFVQVYVGSRKSQPRRDTSNAENPTTACATKVHNSLSPSVYAKSA